MGVPSCTKAAEMSCVCVLRAKTAVEEDSLSGHRQRESVLSVERKSVTASSGAIRTPIAHCRVQIGKAEEPRMNTPGRMSLADAFAAALAKEKKAELITGDPEFKPFEKEIKINWLR